MSLSPPFKKKCLPVIRGGGFKTGATVGVGKTGPTLHAVAEEGDTASPSREAHVAELVGRLQQTVDAALGV
eukprot:2745958-Rhodomonas_salina.2